MYFPFYWIIKLFIWKESVNSDGQQFHQYQQKQTIASHRKLDFRPPGKGHHLQCSLHL
jgi:hypothetical protein